MNQIYQALIAIAIVVGAFLFGRSTAPPPTVTTQVRVDTVRITAPAAPTVAPRESITAELPLADVAEIRAQVIDSMLSMGYAIEVATKISEVIPEVASSEVPISDYTFKDPSYEIGVSGYDVNLRYVDIYQTNTTSVVEQQRTWRLYGSVGMASIGGAYYPSIGALVTTRNNLAFGLDVSAYNGDAMWMARVSYKFLGK